MSTTDCQIHSAGVIYHILPDKVRGDGVGLCEHLSELWQRHSKVLKPSLELSAAGLAHNEPLHKVRADGVGLCEHLSELWQLSEKDSGV